MTRVWAAFAAVIVLSFAVLGWIGVRIYQQAPPIAAAVVTDRRSDAAHARRCGGGTERLAVDGRDGTGLHLGPRQLRRAGLDGGLAAPRGGRSFSMSGPAGRRGVLRGARTGAAGGAARAADETDADQHLRSRDRTLVIAPGGPARSRRTRRTTPTCSATADGLRDSGRHADRPGARCASWPPSSSGRRGRPPPTAPATRSPTRATGRTSRSSATGRPAMRSSGPASASSCCSPASARWRGGTRRRRTTPPLGAVPDERSAARRRWPTPSQRATVKYFWIVSALILAADRARRRHRALRRRGRRLLRHPARDRSCPTPSRAPGTCSSGIFWIATAWLAAGLYIAPAVGGAEPRFQRLGVNVLFGALLVVVVGSMAGEWLSVKQMLSAATPWFYFGHSGYEYIDLGRALADRAARRAASSGCS